MWLTNLLENETIDEDLTGSTFNTHDTVQVVLIKLPQLCLLSLYHTNAKPRH